MKSPGSRSIVLIGIITNGVALVSMFLPYTEYRETVSPQTGGPTFIAWEFLYGVLRNGRVPGPFLSQLFSELLSLLFVLTFLCALLFPLGVHLASFTHTIQRKVFLISSIAGLIGVLWCTLLNASFLSMTTPATPTSFGEYYTLELGAQLLLLCLLVSTVSDVIQWNISGKRVTDL